jgi:hypothetical protein
MITRHRSLSRALDQVEAGALTGVSTVVVSRRWWSQLSVRERSTYRLRARQAGIELRTDSAMSTHYVEAQGSDIRPLSTERAVRSASDPRRGAGRHKR